LRDRQAGAHDFTEDRAYGGAREDHVRTRLNRLLQPFEEASFALRIVPRKPCVLFERGDFAGDSGAALEQLEDAIVERVNPASEVVEAHSVSAPAR
jgi:hypothetical protein